MRSRTTWIERHFSALIKQPRHQQLEIVQIGTVWMFLQTNLNSSLYSQPEFVDYKDMHYEANDYRKIRDIYNALLESVQNDINRGNQSGKGGDQITYFITLVPSIYIYRALNYPNFSVIVTFIMLWSERTISMNCG